MTSSNNLFKNITIQQNKTTARSTWATVLGPCAVPHKVELVTAKSLYLSIINFIISVASAAACQNVGLLLMYSGNKKCVGKNLKILQCYHFCKYRIIYDFRTFMSLLYSAADNPEGQFVRGTEYCRLALTFLDPLCCISSHLYEVCSSRWFI